MKQFKESMSCQVLTVVYVKIEVLWDDMLCWLVNTDILGNVLPVPSASGSFGCLTSMKTLIFS